MGKGPVIAPAPLRRTHRVHVLRELGAALCATQLDKRVPLSQVEPAEVSVAEAIAMVEAV